jgi:AraC-like DNA-binding protein
MAWLTTVSTDHVTRDRRVDYWNAAACSALVAQCADPADKAHFSGRMRSGDIGDIRMVELSSAPATVRHAKEHVARVAGEHFLLRIQRSGESVTLQDGQEVRLLPGDFTLCDSRRQYSLSFTSPASFLTLRFDRATLNRHFGRPDRLLLVRVPGDHGFGLLASRLLQRIADGFDDVVNAITYPRLSNAVMEIVFAACEELGGESRGRRQQAVVRRACILDFVESHLGDPTLAPSEVARRLGISRRHLHGLFEAGTETLASYIWRRRLERARFVLLDSRRSGWTLSQIAAENGFKTLAHFSRSFRQAFGSSPNELRQCLRSHF